MYRDESRQDADAIAALDAQAAQKETQERISLLKRLKREADSAAQAASGEAEKEAAELAGVENQSSKAALMWRKRRDLLKGDSAAAKVTEALRGATAAGLRLAARQHQLVALKSDARAAHQASSGCQAP